jgi:hypothetical protein
LRPGVYRVVPSANGLTASGHAVAVVIDATGARPAARMPELTCATTTAKTAEPAQPVPLLAVIAGAQVALGDVPPVHVNMPSEHEKVSAGKVSAGGLAPEAGARTVLSRVGEARWPTVAMIASLLAAALFLALALVQGPYNVNRFALARALDAHRQEVGALGVVALFVAWLLFVLTWLGS